MNWTGTIHGDYADGSWPWGTDPESYVKAWISGETKESTVKSGFTPTWGHSLDMGCPSNENATLNLQMFEVCSV